MIEIKSHILKRNVTSYMFLLPWLIGLFGLTIGPMIVSFYMSFTDFNLMNSPKWIGAQNYSHIFSGDKQFYQSLWTTFTYVILSVPLKLSAALFVAIMLNKGMKGVGFYRTVYYIPSLLGGSVAISVLWKEIFAGEGLFNKVLSIFGIQGKAWISNPNYIMYTIVVLAVWQFGSSMVIFLAGLKQIPTELYEASEMDGAGKAAKFFKVTIPLLTPVIFFNLVMNIISSFQVFTPGYIIGDGRGGPINSTLFYTLYLYLKGFSFLDMGYASALAWIMVLIISFFTFLFFVTSRFWVHYTD